MNLEKDMKNSDGTIDTLIITSSNNSNPLEPNKTYKLVNNLSKQDKIINKFKNSILGTEVGINAEGFSNIALLGAILAISSVITMYILWRL